MPVVLLFYPTEHQLVTARTQRQIDNEPHGEIVWGAHIPRGVGMGWGTPNYFLALLALARENGSGVDGRIRLCWIAAEYKNKVSCGLYGLLVSLRL